MRRLRVYVDTSVFGGVHDVEFAEASRRFFDGVRAGRFLLLLSDVTIAELAEAPEKVRAVLESLPPDAVERVGGDEAGSLAEAYLEAGVLSESCRADARHVATATTAGADLIVSWNFKHIVNYSRIMAFNGVNLTKAYRAIDIRSPLEIGDEDEDV